MPAPRLPTDFTSFFYEFSLFFTSLEPVGRLSPRSPGHVSGANASGTYGRSAEPNDPCDPSVLVRWFGSGRPPRSLRRRASHTTTQPTHIQKGKKPIACRANTSNLVRLVS